MSLFSLCGYFMDKQSEAQKDKVTFPVVEVH